MEKVEELRKKSEQFTQQRLIDFVFFAVFKKILKMVKVVITKRGTISKLF